MPIAYHGPGDTYALASASATERLGSYSGVWAGPWQATQAANGLHPSLVDRVACFGRGLGAPTNIYMVVTPAVNGNNTTNTITVPNTPTYDWRWADLSMYYSDTPGARQNFAVYDTGGGGDIGLTMYASSASDGFYTGLYDSAGNRQLTYSNRVIQWAYHYQQAPSAPGNLRASSSTGSYGAVDLAWDSPGDWGEGSSLGYRIFVNGGFWGDIGNQNNLTVGGLNPGQQYTFQIAARNNVTNYFNTTSLYSNSVYGTASSLPSAAYNFTASQNGSTAGRIDLSWSAPGAGYGATYLQYYIYDTTNGNPIANTSNTYYSITGLNNWQTYTYYVVAHNQFGNAGGSNQSSAISPGVPSAPYNLSASASTSVSGRISVSWAQPSQTSGGITRYTIYENGSQVGQTAGNVTSITLDGYTPGTNHSFDVRAWNAWGDANGQFGAYSGAVSVAAQGLPSAPTNVSAASQAAKIGDVQVSWSAPTNTAGSISFYNIYVDGAFTTSVSGSATSVTLSGITSNASHTFGVAARNAWAVTANQIGPRTTTASVYVPGVPSAPQNLGAISSDTIAGLISLSWTAPATVGGTAGKITHYVITRTDGSGNVTTYDTASGSNPTTTTYDWQTTPKTVSTFYVVAYNDAGDAASTPSPRSSSVSITSSGGAASPTNLILTPGTTSIGRLTLTWLPPAGTIVSYTITRNDGVVTTISATKFVDDNVVPGTTYSYYVQATNTTGVDGQPSDTVSGVANTTSTQAVANVTVVNNTNTDLSGDYTISSAPTGSSFTYRQITPALTQTAVPTGAGTLVDKTNVFLNGTYFGNVVAPNQVNIGKAGTPFSLTTVSNGTLTDNTNVALNGNQKRVTAVNSATKAFSYAATYQDTSQRPAAGTIINTTNEVFNNGGNPVTISSCTENTFTYPITAADFPETTATGTATDITNRDYFNGHYSVSRVVSPVSFAYERVPQNLRSSLTNLVTNPRMETLGTTFTLHTNRITNPSFEVDLAGWTPDANVTAIRSTDFAYAGSASMLVTKQTLPDSASGVGITLTGLTSGATYTISGYFRSGNGDAKPYFSVSGRSSSNPINLTTAWQRTSYTFTANNTSHTFYIQSGVATVANANFYVDALLVQETTLVNQYFDGSTANTSDFTFAWTGTAHASISTMTATSVSNTSTGTDGSGGQTYWAKAYSTTAWTNDGTRSLALVNRGAHIDQWVNIAAMVPGLAAGKTYTFMATIRIMDSVIDPQQIRLQVQNTNGSTAYVYSNIIGTPGVYTFSGTFNTTGHAAGDYVRLYNRVNQPGALVYWDSIMIFEGSDLSAPFFTGASTSTSMTKYAWTGAVDNSTSTRVSDLTPYSGSIGIPYGGVARSDNPAAMDIYYRSGWLG